MVEPKIVNPQLSPTEAAEMFRVENETLRAEVESLRGMVDSAHTRIDTTRNRLEELRLQRNQELKRAQDARSALETALRERDEARGALDDAIERVEMAAGILSLPTLSAIEVGTARNMLLPILPGIATPTTPQHAETGPTPDYDAERQRSIQFLEKHLDTKQTGESGLDRNKGEGE